MAGLFDGGSMATLTQTVPVDQTGTNQSLETVGDLATISSLAVVDTSGRLTSALEGAVDCAADTVNATVPATVRFVGSFFLPEIVNQVVSKGVSAVTHAATWLVSCSTTAVFHAATFGVPAWSQALRQGLAVSGATGKFNSAESSRDFLARCFAESSETSLIKETLLQYLELRKELRMAREKPGGDRAISELAKAIAGLEVRLRDYQDFRDLKSILERGTQFVSNQHQRIDQLALETADRVIARVENYYKDNVGSLAGSVEGAWASQEARQQQRQLLREQIAKRLQGVFLQELNSEETAAEIAKVSSELHTAFGTYRASFKAAMLTALGVGYATGALQAGLEAAWSAAGSALNSLTSALSDGAQSLFAALRGWASDRLSESLQSVVDSFASSLGAVADSVGGAVENALDTVGGFFDNSSIYDSPYYTRSNQIVTGFDPSGQPIYGQSCISAFPAVPRIESMGLDGSLGLKLERFAPSPVDLLNGIETGTELEPGALEALRNWVTGAADK